MNNWVCANDDIETINRRRKSGSIHNCCDRSIAWYIIIFLSPLPLILLFIFPFERNLNSCRDGHSTFSKRAIGYHHTVDLYQVYYYQVYVFKTLMIDCSDKMFVETLVRVWTLILSLWYYYCLILHRFASNYGLFFIAIPYTFSTISLPLPSSELLYASI